MPYTGRRRAAGWLAGLGVLLAGPAGAQQAPGLSLDEVVRMTVAANPDIRQGHLRVEVSQGRRVAAAAPFQTQLNTRFAGLWGDETAPGASADFSRSSEMQLGLQRQLRFGLTLASDVSVLRNQPATGLALNASQVQLHATLPLLKNRGGGLWRSLEQAADGHWRAESLAALGTTATGVRDAVAAYWRYRTAEQRLAVLLESEQRAERLAEEMRSLVAAEERTTSDLTQVLANAAGRRIGRINAEQAVVSARRELGLLLGVEPGRIQALPPTRTDFPAPAPFAPEAAEVERLTALARARRAELAASGERVRSSGLLLRAARSDLRPRLNLTGTFAYAGLATGRGFDRWAMALPPERGPQGTLSIEYFAPLSGGEERGIWMERSAQVKQQRVADEQLTAEVVSGVELAVEALRHSTLALREAEASVELFRTAVENQRTKFRLSAATLVDVLFAEEALTNMRLSEASSRLDHALALTRLRFETGTLVERGADGAAVDVAGLTSIP